MRGKNYEVTRKFVEIIFTRTIFYSLVLFHFIILFFIVHLAREYSPVIDRVSSRSSSCSGHVEEHVIG